MILPIYLYGAEVLRKKAKEIDPKDDKERERITELIANMWETMYNAEGVGLAAPQVGESVRLLIVDGSPLEESYPQLASFKRVMINPTILEESEEIVGYDEGCLSIPDVWASVNRPESIEVEYLDENFNLVNERLDGFGCRMVQHEIDHLDGILFVDKVAPIRKKMIKSKLLAISSGKVEPRFKFARR